MGRDLPSDVAEISTKSLLASNPCSQGDKAIPCLFCHVHHAVDRLFQRPGSIPGLAMSRGLDQVATELQTRELGKYEIAHLD